MYEASMRKLNSPSETSRNSQTDYENEDIEDLERDEQNQKEHPQEASTSKPENEEQEQEQETRKSWKDYIIRRLVVTTVILMGILADVLHAYIGCSLQDKHAGRCSAINSYYLCPVAVITGMVCGGYLTTQPTGVITNLMTGHLGKVPAMITKLSFTYFSQYSQRVELRRKKKLDLEELGDEHNFILSNKADFDTLQQSFGIIVLFFLGCLSGMSVPERAAHTANYPLFTIVGCLIAILVFIFDCSYNESVQLVVLADELRDEDDDEQIGEFDYDEEDMLLMELEDAERNVDDGE